MAATRGVGGLVSQRVPRSAPAKPGLPAGFRFDTGMPVFPRISLGRVLVLDEELNVERYPAFALQDDPRFLSGDKTIAGLCAEKIQVVSDAFDKITRGFADSSEMGKELMPLVQECRTQVIATMAEQQVNSSLAVQKILESLQGLRQNREDKTQATYWGIYKILAKMLMIAHQDIRDFNEQIECSGFDQVVVVCADLADTDLGLLSNRKVRGIVRGRGSRVDHVALAAGAKEISHVCHLGEQLTRLRGGDLVIIDESAGTIIVNPEPAVLAAYQAKKARLKGLQESLRPLRTQHHLVCNGRALQFLGNVVYPNDVARVFGHGLDGIGLVRTECFYAVGSDGITRKEAPCAEEQLAYYRALVAAARGPRLVIRTLDPAEDKELPYFRPLYEGELPTVIGRESGLGVCLMSDLYPDYHRLFLEQMKAMLQVGGRFGVMFPMVRRASEFNRAMALIEATKVKLSHAGIAVNNKIRFGCMIEHPDILPELHQLFAHKRLSFISVGTSDLTQFITGVSRHNGNPPQTFNEMDPRVLTAMQQVFAQAQKHRKKISCCGDMANDWRALLWLWGAGFDAVSLSTGMVDLAKKIAASIQWADLSNLVNEVARATTAEQVRHSIEQFTVDRIEDGNWEGLAGLKPLLFPDQAV